MNKPLWIGIPTALIVLLLAGMWWYNEEPALFEQAVAAGARGFLRKDVSPEELLAAIESVHAGQTAYAPTASQAVRNAGQFTTPAGGADVPTLTERERSILRLMAGGYANREIASMLFLA